MDYFFLSSLQQATPDQLVVLYDIACQWSMRLGERCKLYGDDALSFFFFFLSESGLFAMYYEQTGYAN